MANRLMGLSDEQRLAIEQESGIKTEGVRLILEASLQQADQLAKQVLDKTIREVQEVVGPHGSVSRLQAGGVKISQGLGVAVYEDGVLKTTIEPDGDLLVGSDITQPSTTSFAVFVNEQTYNNELMGAGDLLFGDNTEAVSNVKFDASEGQLQFRYGQIVKAYMDTDGSLKAGGGAVVLGEDGQIISDGGDALTFYDSSYGSYSVFSFKPNYDGGKSSLQQLVFTVENETNQISNGDFETGDLTGWTETDAGTNISVEAGEGYNGSYALKFANAAATATDYIEQSLAATGTRGVIIRLKARTLGDGAGAGAINLQNGTDSKNIEVPSNEWRTFYEILPASTASIKISIPSTSGTIYIDDINIRILETGTTIPSASYISVKDTLVDILGASGIRMFVGWSSSPFRVDFTTAGLAINENGGDFDTRIEGDTDTSLFLADASLDAIGMGGAAESGYKLNVTGKVNLTTGNTYDINGTPHTHTGLVTNGDSHDHNGGDGAAITDANLSTSDITTNNASTTKHGFLLKATAPSSGLMNVVGIENGETVYANKALFDNTNPADLGTAAPGTAMVAARRDHVHGGSSGGGLSGWTEVTDSWTYASASTITIPSDGTTTYQKWMKIRFKQGGGYKYYVASAVAATLLTVVVNTLHTVANAAITDIAVSFIDNPYGFPDVFTYSPTPTLITVGNGTLTARYSVRGDGLFTCQVELVFGSTTTIDGTGPSFALPATGMTLGATQLSGIARLQDVSPNTVYQGAVPVSSGATGAGATVINASATYATNTSVSATVPFTWTTSDVYSIMFSYFAA